MQRDIVICGGGISGLAALHFVRTLLPERSVILLEATGRLGGTIGTDLVDGYSFDWGPNGFLDREPLTLRLSDELGLQDVIERANEKVNNRFIYRGGRLRSVPMSPPKFLTSDILSIGGRARVLMEPLAQRRPDGIDESIYDFGVRRIGREAADYLIAPMVSGVFGGVAERLSLKSCFPIMREMEDNHGSLFRAMIVRARRSRREGRSGGGPSGPAGRLTSYRQGLYRLTERLEERYRMHIETGRTVVSIERNQTGYTILTASGEPVTAGQVILAMESFQAAPVVRRLSGVLGQALEAIPYAPISVVCFGFRTEHVKRPLDGFGFLVPAVEKRRILGSIWTSSIFDNRSPEGRVQFRTMVGGDGDHDSIRLDEPDLIELVRSEMDAIVGLSGQPDLVRVYRWSKAIPQYRIGHSTILDRIESARRDLPGLHFTGNAYRGVSLNDCVKLSYAVVNRIAESAPRPS